ncbi:MAG: phosphoglycerate kinase [Actinomycetota bacterium]
MEVEGRRVLVRADLNVPLADGRVTDDFRIRSFLPTLERILERGGTAVVCSHLGRPKQPDPKFTLAPVAAVLSDALAGDIPLAIDYDKIPNERVVLLENLRFNPGETKNDPAFAAKLSSLGDAYVNDAFGACHRAHASIVGPPSRLPSAAGLLLSKEIETLSSLLGEPKRPFVVVLGGVKVSDKIGVVKNFLDRADEILIGGAMTFTFLKARGARVGTSIIDEDSFADVERIATDERIVLPDDIVAAPSFDATGGDVVDAMSIPDGWMGLDIGPDSAERFASSILGAGTVLWNGPMGVFEKDAFADGSRRVAEAIAKTDAYTVTGGGDTSAVLAKFGLERAVDFASTGGGASLEFLEGKTLPGIAALQAQKES